MRRSGYYQRSSFSPNNILQGATNLLDCDNQAYSAPSYTINGPPLPFDITCDANTFTVRARTACVRYHRRVLLNCCVVSQHAESGPCHPMRPLDVRLNGQQACPSAKAVAFALSMQCSDACLLLHPLGQWR